MQAIKNLAPVLISVYDRLDCLQNAIESLAKNTLAKQTDVFIVSDAPYSKEFEIPVQKVRDYIISLKKSFYFKNIEGIFWESNKGSFQSGRDAFDYLYSKYDRVISFEDDVIVSNEFLNYMNDALQLYQDDKRIISIASNTHYHKIVPKSYPYEVFLLKMYSPWGVGMWKDRYENIDWDLEGIQDFFKDKKQLKAFNSISRHLLPILEDTVKNNKKHADGIICYNMFQQNTFTLYPIKPLSVNRGYDGRGEHCDFNDNWQHQQLSQDFCPKLIKNIPYCEKIGENQAWAFYSYRRDFVHPILVKLKLLPLAKKIKILIKNPKKDKNAR
ncbi:glycosyl transferase [Helicobacter sp. 13S00477-4]|uniref:glycosyl transferase n=1 Tax=Helicobacter sp. 13S00477-4 TaxID=1905759 RepID=UPI000BA5A164|nr:glycosyl transferase [Helicobacter sp. 13S00477-4]PAF51945.1 hypothetical protein BKH44_04600 [Helicobacter sp. 13S00477-4]